MAKFIPTTQDEKSRCDIIEKINTNLFVEAGAGSGKTTMLVNRMVAMIEAGIPVEKICAITFTKNAALEFYERFQAKLIDRADPNNNNEPVQAGDLDVPNDITRNRCLVALENIDLCFMGTIDSFCNMVLSEHPVEANIPSDARLIDDNEAKKIYRDFYLKARSGLFTDEIKMFADRFSIFYWRPEEAFATLMAEIMDRRNVNFVVKDDLCIDFYKCFNSLREDTKKVLDTFNKDLSKLTIKLDNKDDRDPIQVYLDANEVLQKGWQYNYIGVQKAVKDISNLIYYASVDELGFTNESIVRENDSNTVLNVKDEENPEALLFKLNNYKYQNSLKLCQLCIEPLEDLMRKQGKLTYFDYLYYLRNMLIKDIKNNGNLISYIYDRHSYFLIDEFQDTNPMQAEVFFYLTAQNLNINSFKDSKPKPGSLFIVGDPKQSIYRFRSADVSSYLSIKKLFENNEVGEVKYLVNNFRSKNIVKQYFNDVFEDVMSTDTNEQSKYLDIENCFANENEEEFKGIFTYESYSESLLNEFPDMSDNNRILLIVKTLVNNPKYRIIDRKTKKLRTISYGDFMIIFSAKKNIASCIKVFNEENIPVKVEGKVLFEECMGLQIIYSIYKTITNTDDEISLVSTLYSPLFGLNENDLAQYVKSKNKIRLDINKEYGNTNIEKALNRLSAFTDSISTLTPSALFEKIMDDFEVFKYVDSDGLEIVYYVLELIRNEEHSGKIVTFIDVINYIEDLLSGNSDLERCLSLTQKEDAIHIANLHKVKGLEAPIVILTKAGSANTSPSIRIEYIEDENNNTEAQGYIINVQEKNDDYDIALKVIETNAHKEKADQEKESLKKENDRLIYVAATRARNVLIINEPKMRGRSGNPQGMANKWKPLKEKANTDFFKVIDENSSYKKPTHEEVEANKLYDEVSTTKLEKKQSYQYKKPSDISSVSKLEEENFVEEIDNTSATLLGTMVHRLMEMIVVSNDSLNKQSTIINILNEYITIEFEQNRDTYKQTLEDIYDVIHNGGYPQNNGVDQDILSLIKNADNVYAEVPFTYMDNDKNIWNGIIDLIYEKNNELHIIDWKTNKKDDDLDNHYKKQLEAYKKAVKHALGKDVEDALIYHIKT